METDKLIQTLTVDHRRSPKPLLVVIVVALLAAAPFALGMFGMRLGVRPDIAAVAGNPFFLLKFAVMLGLVVAAGTVAMRLARPAKDVAPPMWLFAVPVLLLIAGIAMDFYVPQQRSWSQRLVGTNALVCMMAIPMLSIPFLIAAFVGLRHGASTRPGFTGALAGLLAGALGAGLYAAHCGDDSPLFVAIWYSLGIGPVVAFGALAGKKLLRF